MADVFSLALGPVQDFLVAARRTRDLWFGSWLLSELARAAGKTLRDAGERLIFPDAGRLDDADATFSNKILAIVEHPPADVATAVRLAIERRLIELRDEAFKRIVKEPLFLHERARAQITDLIEIQWASAPLIGDYRAARQQAEALLGARKNTRIWGPVTWGDQVPKSAIDGQRESILHEDLFDSRLGPGARRLYELYHVGDNERLCGIGLFKRLGRRPSQRFAHNFLSTGHLAARPFLDRLAQLVESDSDLETKISTAWAGFVAKAQALDPHCLDECRIFAENERHPVLGDLDASLLFENRLGDLFVDPEPRTRRQRAEPLFPLLRAFLTLAGATPRPYFAVLVADGDRMGKVIDAIDDPARHQALSRQLTTFASETKSIVEKDHGGELILAGGDDVLAFVPLHRALACARTLAARFAELLAAFRGAEGEKATLSVGLGIAHFREPLARALGLARAAEKLAKQKRDALAIQIDKRSGETVAVVGRWGEIDRDLQDFVTLHREDRVPDGLAFELRALALLPHGAAPDTRVELEAIMRKEAARILRSKQPRHGRDDQLAKEVFERLDKSLEIVGLRVLADRLIVARLLAEAEVLAAPKPAEVVA